MSEENTTQQTNTSPADVARFVPVLVGTRQSVLEALEREIPLQDEKTADRSKRFFYANASFADQIERIMRYNKTAGNKYVYAVIPYSEYVPDAEMSEELKNVPEQYRAMRFVRAEIHR